MAPSKRRNSRQRASSIASDHSESSLQRNATVNKKSAKARYENWKQKGGIDKESVSDEDDSEIDSDEAFDSDDEDLFGDMFQRAEPDESSSEESESVSEGEGEGEGDEEEDDASDSDASSSSDSDDNENDGGAYMLSLLDNIKSDPSPSQATSDSTTIHNNAMLSMDDLLNPITEHNQFSATKNNLSHLSATKVTSAPLPTSVQGRIERNLKYDESKKDVKGWLGTIKENREAETLDFRGDLGKNRKVVTLENMGSIAANDDDDDDDDDDGNNKHDYEKEIMQALEKQREQEEEVDLAAVAERDFMDDDGASSGDDLGEGKMTESEIRKRHSELAKIRSLMFYEERKRHQINKIKSKKYRKIRKKKAEKEKEKDMELIRQNDPELARELDEKEEIARMKERMTLQHKNTSKWARQQLRRGKNIDADTRKALSAQITQGDELRRKMMGDGESDGSDSDGNYNANPAERYIQAKQIAQANDDSEDEEMAKNKSGLFGLEFMQRGIKNQRERAKEEALRLMNELRDEMGDAISDDGGGDSEDDFTYDSSKVTEIVEKPQVENEPEVAAVSNAKCEALESNDNDADVKGNSRNPWLSNNNGGKHSKSKNQSRDKLNTNIINVDDINRGVDLIIKPTELSDKLPISTETNEKDMLRNKAMTEKTQEELVREAFAGDTNAEEDFRKEKEAMMMRDDPSLNKAAEDDGKVSGWGSWGGMGVKAPKKKKKKNLPKKLQAPDKAPAKRKRADEQLPTVIINEKRIKKTSAYKVSEIPYPFTSAEQYEKAMIGALGSEWNTTQAVKNLTRPEIVTRIGKVIDPISRKMKSKKKKEARGGAKF